MEEDLIQGSITGADGTKNLRTVQITILGEEVRENLEHVEPYGFTSEPFTDGKTDAIALNLNKELSHGVVIAIADRRYRIKNMEQGEVAIYDDKGRTVFLHREGIEINGVDSPINIHTTGNIYINSSATVNVDAKEVNITSPSNNVNGPLKVTGLITGQGGLAISGGDGASVTGTIHATGDITAGSISLQNHIHGGVEAGGADTSKAK